MLAVLDVVVAVAGVVKGAFIKEKNKMSFHLITFSFAIVLLFLF